MSRKSKLWALVVSAGICGLVFVILLLQQLAKPQFRTRWDLTQNRDVSLSLRSIAALKELPRDSRIVAFLFPEEERLIRNGSAVYPLAFQRILTLLEDARIQTGLPTLVLDTNSSPVEIETVATALGRSPGECLFIETPSRKVGFRFEDLFVTQDPTPEGAPARIRSERVDTSLGNAARRLALKTAPEVLLLHPEGVPPSEAFLELLRGEGWQPRPTTQLLALQEGSLLVVLNHLQPLSSDLTEGIHSWLDRGFPCLITLGLSAPVQAVEWWNQTMQTRGIAFLDGMLCEPVKTVSGPMEGSPETARLEILAVGLSGQHPSTRNLAAQNRSTLIVGARPLGFSTGSNHFTRTPLLRTGKAAWIESTFHPDFQLSNGERRGVQNVAMAAEAFPKSNRATGGRTIALGTALIFQSEHLPFCKDFLIHSLRWLINGEAKDPGLVAVEALPFRPTRQTMVRMTNISVIGLPGFTALIALLLYWKRRR